MYIRMRYCRRISDKGEFRGEEAGRSIAEARRESFGLLSVCERVNTQRYVLDNREVDLKSKKYSQNFKNKLLSGVCVYLLRTWMHSLICVL